MKRAYFNLLESLEPRTLLSVTHPFSPIRPQFADPIRPAVTYNWQTQIINGALNIWVPNPGDFGSTFTITDPTMLYGPDGIPQIEGVHQGPIADCYFLSAAGSLAIENPTHIQSLIKTDANGGWAVTFQYWNNPALVPVVIHTSNQLSSSLQVVSNGEVWSLVLEKAYAAFRTWNGLTSTNTMASLGWGYEGAALQALGSTYKSVYAWGTGGTFTIIQSELLAHAPVLMETTFTAPTMVQSHVYIITGTSIDVNGVQWVTTYNPWGFFDTRTIADIIQNNTGLLTVGVM